MPRRERRPAILRDLRASRSPRPAPSAPDIGGTRRAEPNPWGFGSSRGKSTARDADGLRLRRPHRASSPPSRSRCRELRARRGPARQGPATRPRRQCGAPGPGDSRRRRKSCAAGRSHSARPHRSPHRRDFAPPPERRRPPPREWLQLPKVSRSMDRAPCRRVTERRVATLPSSRSAPAAGIGQIAGASGVSTPAVGRSRRSRRTGTTIIGTPAC